MTKATIIGIDLAKSTFQLHGAAGNGAVVFRKKLSRDKLLSFLAGQPAALVAMEACASAHYWGREIATLGHEVKLVPPIYVKPFVKRQSEADQRMIRLLIRPPNDAADAEAIVEAASRPTMRFVEVKTAEQQGQGMLFRTRDLLVRQRTQSINALRGHLAEFGIVAPQGPARVVRLAQAVSDETVSLPDTVRELARLLLDQIAALGAKIGGSRSGRIAREYWFLVGASAASWETLLIGVQLGLLRNFGAAFGLFSCCCHYSGAA